MIKLISINIVNTLRDRPIWDDAGSIWIDVEVINFGIDLASFGGRSDNRKVLLVTS